MKTGRWLLLGLLVLLGRVTHAEGECPPGMFPTNPPGAQGPVGCAPIPGYDQQQQAQPPQQNRPPPPQWASRWGAIATDGPGGSFGAAVNQSSGGAAESAALADCLSKKGSSNCKIEVSYANGCGVMTIGDKMHNSNYGNTVAEATQKGMTMCRNAGDTKCHVYYSACSLPVQIQ
jgi:hypothetical protein